MVVPALSVARDCLSTSPGSTMTPPLTPARIVRWLMMQWLMTVSTSRGTLFLGSRKCAALANSVGFQPTCAANPSLWITATAIAKSKMFRSSP
jgi:hypothetical protein